MFSECRDDAGEVEFLLKLNLGCGIRTPAGWVNVDYALGARFAKLPFFRALNRRLGLFRVDWDEGVFLLDLTGRFPWADGSVDVIYSSHTLEHLSRQEGRRFLGECRRVLRSGGIIRLVLPDLQWFVGEYTAGRLPADEFLEELRVLYRPGSGRWTSRLYPLLVQHPHKCMYDHRRLLQVLDETGFQAAARQPFDSDIEHISEIETEGRTAHAVIVEGRKTTARP